VRNDVLGVVGVEESQNRAEIKIGLIRRRIHK
jgi:hypothetical protein